MKDDENVHPVKLILCQCEKIIKLILCLIFHLLTWTIIEISLRKTNIISLCLFDLLDQNQYNILKCLLQMKSQNNLSCLLDELLIVYFHFYNIIHYV